MPGISHDTSHTQRGRHDHAQVVFLLGQGDAAEAFRQELAELEERNRQARAEWDSLTPEEREQRTRDFEAQKKARAEAMRDAAEIPPHVLAKIDGKEPPDPDAVFT